VPDACQFFSFADETVSNTISREAHMAWGTAMTTYICRQPGDGSGFCANSGLKPQECSGPTLGLIFLRFAEVINFAKRIQELRRTRDLLLPRLLSGQVNLKTD
jgi:hypothetical protein